MLQLRKEELRKLKERQAAAVDADEEDLAREFSGSVRLTVHEQQDVTLTPDQVCNDSGWRFQTSGGQAACPEKKSEDKAHRCHAQRGAETMLSAWAAEQLKGFSTLKT
jgi:hypothetical protein